MVGVICFGICFLLVMRVVVWDCLLVLFCDWVFFGVSVVEVVMFFSFVRDLFDSSLI